MNASELRQRSADELRLELDGLMREQFNLRMQKGTGQLSRPDQVKKVIKTVQQQGVGAAYRKVMSKLDSLTPLGYSLSGEVTAVGEGAE